MCSTTSACHIYCNPSPCLFVCCVYEFTRVATGSLYSYISSPAPTFVTSLMFLSSALPLQVHTACLHLGRDTALKEKDVLGSGLTLPSLRGGVEHLLCQAVTIWLHHKPHRLQSSCSSCQAVCMADCKAGLHIVNHLDEEVTTHRINAHALSLISCCYWMPSLQQHGARNVGCSRCNGRARRGKGGQISQ